MLSLLNLNELNDGLPAITPQWGSALAQAAGVCLESQDHSRGVLLRVIGYASNTYALIWPPIDDQARRSWADPQEATEYGATAVAVLLVKRETGYEVVERSAKGTGIDYWLGHEADGPPFQDKARLEISGILNAEGDGREVERVVARRVREKLVQTQPTDGALPAFVVVIEFGSPLCEVRRT